MKKIFFFVLILSALFCLRGASFAAQTILWIPYHSSAINEVLKILESNENIRITAALDQISPKYEKRIKALEENGQLEIALRLPGDPIIPLLYYPNSDSVSWSKKPAKSALPDNAPYFMGLRIGTAMDNAKKNLIKRRPKGLVLPPGTMMKDYFPLAKGIGIKWIASGPFYYEEEDASTENVETTDVAAPIANVEKQSEPANVEIPDQNTEYSGTGYISYVENGEGEENTESNEELAAESSIAEVSGVKVIPFVPYAENADNANEEFIVFDETAEEDPAPLRSSFKAYISNFQGETITAGELAENTMGAELTPDEMEKTAQPWTDDYGRWANSSNQMGTLVAMSQTRSELMKHYNANQGNMKESMPAFSAYYEAENGRRFLNLGSSNAETAKSAEIEMRSALAGVYGIIGKKAPQWSISSLSDAGTGRNTALMRIAMQKTGFEIKNDQNRPVFDEIPANLPENVDPYKLWKLNSIRTELKDNNIVFKFAPAAINNSESSLSGFSHIAIDLYIDVNHRINAGATTMLPGRPMKMAVEDSWEYALEISPTAVYLYRSTSMGPKQVGKYRARVLGGAITVTIPGTVLSGTPASWGYVALMMVPRDGNRFYVADTLSSRKYANTVYAVRPGQEAD